VTVAVIGAGQRGQVSHRYCKPVRTLPDEL
jgi:hypothetical protein